MFPARAGAPLDHQLGRRIVGIHIDPHEQPLARRRGEGGGGALEEMLVQAGHRRLGVPATRRRPGAIDRQHRRGSLEGRPQVVVGHEVPALVAVLLGIGRQHAAEPFVRRPLAPMLPVIAKAAWPS